MKIQIIFLKSQKSYFKSTILKLEKKTKTSLEILFLYLLNTYKAMRQTIVDQYHYLTQGMLVLEF